MSWTLKNIKSQVKCKSKFDNDDHYYCLKLELINNKDKLIFLSGFNKFVPHKNDIIEDNFKKINDTLYDTKKILINLPTNIIHQKLRIVELLKTKENINNFNNIGIVYSSSFWYETFIKLKEFITIDDSGITISFIDIVYSHIKNYYTSIIYYFQSILKNRGLELNYNLCEQIYCHKSFGPNIDKWKIDSLKELFDVNGFGLINILKIAENLNATTIDKSKLIIIYSLENNNNGNCYIEYDFEKWLADYMGSTDYDTIGREINNINEELFNDIIKQLVTEKIVCDIYNKIYSYKIFNKEMNIASYLLELNKSKMSNNFENLETISLSNDIKYNTQQIITINNIFKNDFIVIDGKAGTGKSTIVPGIIYYLKKYVIEPKIFIITPTAKAKMRVLEILKKYNSTELNLLNINMSTIHSFIARCNLKQIIFSENNIFIIDEFSMVDIHLFHNVLSTINDFSGEYNFKLIVMGDIRQLPSINIGDIFYRIKLCREYFNYNELTEIIRNTDELLLSIDDILNSIVPRVNNSFKFIKIDSFQTINIESIILKNYDPNNSIIITMTNQSVDKYTKTIRNILNPLDKINNIHLVKEVEYNYTLYRIGDPVVHTKNFNQEGLYNGMVGNIISIKLIPDCDECIIKVLFNTGLEHKYNTSDKKENKLKYLKPSYIITVHKAQGQEYDNVFVIIDNLRMSNLNLLYTAITRGKESVTVISTKSLLKKCINNICIRNSLLDYIITFKLSYNNIFSLEDYIQNFKKYYIFVSEHDEIIYKKKNYIIDRLCNLYNNNDIVGSYDILLNKVKINKKIE